MFLLLPFVVLAACVPAFAVAWYYATLFRREALLPNPDSSPFDLEVVAVTGERIMLRPRRPRTSRELVDPAIYGLRWASGYAQVSPPVEASGDGATRELAPGATAPAVGTRARLDAFAFTGDPRSGRGLAFTEVQIATPLGPCPAWRIDGDAPETWLIAIHGKGADRREALRALPAFTAAGPTTLVITYRNDVGAPPAPSGHYGYGASEWPDLEAAVRYAMGNGARRIVLAGYSMGGAIALSFMARSPLHDRVSAIILDAPMLDFRATVEFASGKARAPRPVAWAGCILAGWRFGIRWAALNYGAAARRLSVPVLLFHGAADTRVPVATSDAFARSRPDIVTYVRLPHAEHVRSWNVGPEAYEAAVTSFLREHAGG